MNTKIGVEEQTINYLAIELLDLFGNDDPTQQQIDLAESMLSKVAIEQRLLFNRKLTKREIACLLLAAMGKTSLETAKLLNIKKSTVETYRSEIRRKLKCSNLTHAVFKGMRYGYLRPPEISDNQH